MTSIAVASSPATVSAARREHHVRTAVIVALIAAVVIVGSMWWNDVPSWLDSDIQPAVRRMYAWITANRQDHWLFTKVFGPIADLIDAWVRSVLWVLRNLRWTGVLALTAAIGLSTGGWRAAAWGTLAMFGVGVMGYWELTMITLSLMIVGINLLVDIAYGLVDPRIRTE